MRREGRCAALAVLALAFALPSPSASADEPKVKVALAPLGEPVPLDAQVDGRSVVGSASGKVAYAAKRGAKVVAVVDGKPEAREWTKIAAFVPSAQGDRFAYWAQDGDAWFVVSGGEARAAKGNPGSLREGGLTVSADGRHVAYSVRRGDTVVVVHDGVEGPAFPYSASFEVRMSRDGRHVAYPAVVLGEGMKPGPENREGARWRAVVDHVPKEPDHAGIGQLSLSADGGRFAYVADDADRRSTVIVDGKPGATYEDVRDLAFADDGRVVYAARKATNEEVVVLEGKEGPVFQSVLDVAPAPGGKRIAYAARKVFRSPKDQVCVVVVDGKPGADVGQVVALRWSADGSVLAYVTRLASGASAVVVADKAGPEHAEAVMAGNLALSHDGARVGYAVRSGRRYRPVVDGVPWNEADHVAGPFFGPDGLAVSLVQQKTGPVLVVEGVETPIDGGVLGVPLFREPGVVDLVTVRDPSAPKVQRMRATVTKP